MQLGPTEQQLRTLPEHMRQGMADYILKGREPGSFLSAILCNDFMTAAHRADDINRWHLFDYIYFLHNYAPAACHGRASNFTHWMKIGGIEGALAADAAAASAASPQPAEGLAGGNLRSVPGCGSARSVPVSQRDEE